MTDQTHLGAIDLLGEIPGGGGYDQLLDHTIAVDLFGVRCRSVDLPTLIRTKQAEQGDAEALDRPT